MMISQNKAMLYMPKHFHLIHSKINISMATQRDIIGLGVCLVCFCNYIEPEDATLNFLIMCYKEMTLKKKKIKSLTCKCYFMFEYLIFSIS